MKKSLRKVLSDDAASETSFTVGTIAFVRPEFLIGDDGKDRKSRHLKQERGFYGLFVWSLEAFL
jgi:hypothetical protein